MLCCEDGQVTIVNRVTFDHRTNADVLFVCLTKLGHFLFANRCKYNNSMITTTQ